MAAAAVSVWSKNRRGGDGELTQLLWLSGNYEQLLCSEAIINMLLLTCDTRGKTNH